jgi:hypothetical protein
MKSQTEFQRNFFISRENIDAHLRVREYLRTRKKELNMLQQSKREIPVFGWLVEPICQSCRYLDSWHHTDGCKMVWLCGSAAGEGISQFCRGGRHTR